MTVFRTIFGAVAAVCLAVALNLAVIRRGPLDPVVLTVFGTAAVAGVLWLVLTAISMAGDTSRRRSFAGMNSLLASIVFLAICVVIYAMTQRWDRSWDLTQEGRQELAPQTAQVLESLRQDVFVHVLYTPDGYPETEAMLKKTRFFLERCQDHTTRLTFEFIDQQKEIKRIEVMGFTFVDRQGTIVVIRAGTRQKTIPLTGAQPRLHERDFTNALINVIQEKPPMVGFLSGHGERDLSKPDAVIIKSLLESEGYATKSVTISLGTRAIPEDVDVLLINGFAEGLGGQGGRLRAEEIEALDTFVHSGGRLFVLIDPEFPVSAQPVRRNLLTWLEQRLGIVVGDDLVVSGVPQQRSGEISLMSDSEAVRTFGEFEIPEVAEFQGCYAQNHPITRGFDKRLDLMLVRSVETVDKLPDDVTASVILRTLPYSYAETGLLAMKQTGQAMRDPGEPIRSIGVGVAASVHTDIAIGDTGQTRDARIVVIGDSDFVTPTEVGLGGNVNLLLNSVAWLSEREELIAIRPRSDENQPIKLTKAEESYVHWVSTLGVLNIVALAGVIVFWLRRKYQ